MSHHLSSISFLPALPFPHLQHRRESHHLSSISFLHCYFPIHNTEGRVITYLQSPFSTAISPFITQKGESSPIFNLLSPLLFPHSQHRRESHHLSSISFLLCYFPIHNTEGWVITFLQSPFSSISPFITQKGESSPIFNLLSPLLFPHSQHRGVIHHLSSISFLLCYFPTYNLECQALPVFNLPLGDGQLGTDGDTLLHAGDLVLDAVCVRCRTQLAIQAQCVGVGQQRHYVLVFCHCPATTQWVWCTRFLSGSCINKMGMMYSFSVRVLQQHNEHSVLFFCQGPATTQWAQCTHFLSLSCNNTMGMMYSFFCHCHATTQWAWCIRFLSLSCNTMGMMYSFSVTVLQQHNGYDVLIFCQGPATTQWAWCTHFLSGSCNNTMGMMYSFSVRVLQQHNEHSVLFFCQGPATTQWSQCTHFLSLSCNNTMGMMYYFSVRVLQQHNGHDVLFFCEGPATTQWAWCTHGVFLLRLLLLLLTMLYCCCVVVVCFCSFFFFFLFFFYTGSDYSKPLVIANTFSLTVYLARLWESRCMEISRSWKPILSLPGMSAQRIQPHVNTTSHVHCRIVNIQLFILLFFLCILSLSLSPFSSPFFPPLHPFCLPLSFSHFLYSGYWYLLLITSNDIQ